MPDGTALPSVTLQGYGIGADGTDGSGTWRGYDLGL
jgi:hypothetical protein